MSDFDSLLWRPIRSGNEYEKLLPKTTCKPSYVGTGLTDHSIDAMEDNILQYQDQTEKLANVLQRQTLNSTALTIHEFLYNHFQYKADDSDQLLRSPACSWYTRKEGIDCKSYSIFASCLLLNMGITHYIRKIKQPGYAPEEFTHVYVIVPTDQTNGSLSKGYHVIDGTIQKPIEPAFIGYKDLKMDGLKHYSLNGTAQNGSLNGVSLSSLKDLSKQISMKNIKSIFGGIDCWGGSSLTEEGIKTYLANIDKFYQDWAYEFNVSIQQDNTEMTSFLVAKFRGMTIVFENASVRNKQKGWNSCTSARIDAAIKAYRFYRDVVGQVLTAYMDEYFMKVSGSFSQNTNFTSQDAESIYGFRHLNVSPVATNTQPKQMFNPRINVNIPAFSLPAYVAEQTNAGKPIDLDTVLGFLETAGNVIRTVSPGTGGTGSGGVGTGNGNIKNPGQFVPIDGQTKTAGFGVVGWVLLAAGLGFAFTKMKDTGPGAKATSTRTRTPRKTTKTK